MSDIEYFFSDPGFIQEYMKEIYTCLHNECLVAVALLVRSFLERIMIEKVGDCGTFKDTLNEFAKNNLSQTEKTQLETIIEVGHAATHRGFLPKPEDLNLILDIVENIVGRLYVQQAKSEKLKAKIPPRPKR